jgi:hypothetical protein
MEKYARDMNKSETNWYLAKLLPESQMEPAQRHGSIGKFNTLKEEESGEIEKGCNGLCELFCFYRRIDAQMAKYIEW